MLTFYFSGANGHMTESEVLTTGMVGKQVRLIFSPEWDSLAKTVVFSNGAQILDGICTGGLATIPAEILALPLRMLTVGVCGTSSDGSLVIPTIRAMGPRILPGVDPTGDSGTDPTLAVWAQIRAMAGELDDLDTEAKGSLVAAINELAARSCPGDVKSAYEYAVEGGYTGSEALFTAKLAAEYVRCVNGIEPDGNGEILLPIPKQAVQYSAQTLTEAQKNTARNNINAASVSVVESAKELANTANTTANRALGAAVSAQSMASSAQSAANSALANAAGKLDSAGISTRTIVTTDGNGATVTLTVLVKT